MNRVHRLTLAGIPIFFLMLVNSKTLSAQGKISVAAGWGYYELTNIGVGWNISESSSLSLFAGTNFNINDKKLFTAGLSYGHSFPGNLIGKLRPGYSIGAYYWISDDELYYFSSLAFPAMIMVTYPVSESVLIRAEGGGVFNAVMVSDRKQNVEAGYPARANGNVRLGIIYKFGAK